ncbi:hypothetical protein Y032_0002g1150 [Ancylostoma ceylanicum]|uniref:Uncharacterized protein n=1 Tax=Ancylostoma ceylanicum TaxID=53326 RepID=A0A016W0T4_9BILA|nr:hypothetical protein Y032_0002g1150 [Ancylostoma ceylanicum]
MTHSRDIPHTPYYQHIWIAVLYLTSIKLSDLSLKPCESCRVELTLRRCGLKVVRLVRVLSLRDNCGLYSMAKDFVVTL